MSTKVLITGFMMLTFAHTLATAQNANPPRSAREESPAVLQKIKAPANAVTAILVKSWGQNPVWNDLNANWSTYGTIPVSIDQTTLLNSDFTYTDLVNTN